MLAILALPAACCFTYGRFVGNPKQGRSIYLAMMVIFLVGLGIAWWAEVAAPHPMMEGKETRFGIMNSVLWATATTAASNGSINAMHDSLSPLAGLVAVTNILLGECVFGGIGTGVYTILMHVIVTVFIAGLMVGRTPEYLGKKSRREKCGSPFSPSSRRAPLC